MAQISEENSVKETSRLKKYTEEESEHEGDRILREMMLKEIEEAANLTKKAKDDRICSHCEYFGCQGECQT